MVIQGAFASVKNIIERYKTIKKEHQINAEIRDREVRLIGETGEQLGIVSSREALRIAEESGLDLVKISPNANPPVCKVMNYGKYLFEQNKKAKEANAGEWIWRTDPLAPNNHLTPCVFLLFLCPHKQVLFFYLPKVFFN